MGKLLSDVEGAGGQAVHVSGQPPAGDPQPDRARRVVEAHHPAVTAGDPPRRLALGRMAVDHIRARLTERLDELDRWEELAATSDFPPG